jgi:drug/metabolite transporter (DMT)-like permease
MHASGGRFAFAALLLANLCLAFGPWMVRLADTGPVASGFWRVMLAVPLLYFLAARADGPLWPRRALLWTVLLGGFFFAADLAAWHEGILRTKLANATLFGNMSSFLFVLYGFVVLRLAPRPAQVAALLLALVGAALLLGSSYDLSPEYLVGDLLAILAGLFYTGYLIAVDRARRDLGAMPLLALSTLASCLPLLLFALAAGERILPSDWTPLLLLALGSQVAGQGLLVYAMGYLSPMVVGLGLLAQPAVTAIIGWLAYDERFGTADAIGALLICAALVLVRLPGTRDAPA